MSKVISSVDDLIKQSAVAGVAGNIDFLKSLIKLRDEIVDGAKVAVTKVADAIGKTKVKRGRKAGAKKVAVAPAAPAAPVALAAVETPAGAALAPAAAPDAPKKRLGRPKKADTVLAAAPVALAA